MSVEILKPLGGEVYVSGRAVRIEWKSYFGPNESADNLQLFYAWGGESTYHYLGAANDMDIPQGNYDWEAPAVGEMAYLRIKAGLYREDGPELASDVSLHVKIIPSEETPSIYLVDPQPPRPDSLSIKAGSVRLIGWQVTGCRPPYDQEKITVLFSSNGGLNYTEIAQIDPCGVPMFLWNVPHVETTHGAIRLQWGDLDWTANVHPFTVYEEAPPPQPPTADAGPDQVVVEGVLVQLTGAGSSDPETGHPPALIYSWERIDPWQETYPFALDHPAWKEPSFTAPEDVGPEPKVFTFRLTVRDPDGLTDDDTVNITVKPAGPDLTSVSPRQGWFKTPVALRGEHLGGCEVMFGDALAATIPAGRDEEFTIYLPDLSPGERTVSVRNLSGSDTIGGVFTVLPVPYQWDWGFPFHNPSGYDLSWGDYERAFGTDAVYSWLCCDFNLVCRRRCHRVLAELLYNYYVRTMARPGACWGVSVASLKYYSGDYALGPEEAVRHLWFNLAPENDLTRRIKALHISQLSAEVIDYLLDHLADTPAEVADQIIADLDGGRPGVVSLQNISEGMDLLDLSGHALVPVHYEEVSSEETRIYVYDSNREELSMSRENGNPAEYAAITSWDSVPYITVNRHAPETWEFEMADGSRWAADDRFNITVRLGDSELVVPFSGFYYFPRSIAVRSSYSLPVSARGIFMILSGAADGELQDAKGSRLGFDHAGVLHMEIAGGMPVTPMGGASFRAAEAYLAPVEDYTVHVYGREAGEYTWQSHGEWASFAVKDARTTAGIHDTLRVGAGNDYLSLLAGGDGERDVISEAVAQAGEQTWARTFELHGLKMLPGEQVIVRQGESPDSVVVANLSSQPKLLNLTFNQALLGPQPEPPEYPTAEESTLTVNQLLLPAAAALQLTPEDWNELQGTELKIGRLPDRDGDGLDDAFEKRIGTDPTRSDTDKDSMSDAWEFRHGLNPAVAAGKSLDSDGDGLLDVEEARYGADPSLPGGPFRIFHVALDENHQLELRFNTQPGHTYQVERSSSASSGKWQSVGDPIKTDRWNERFRETPSQNTTARFYRVRQVN